MKALTRPPTALAEIRPPSPHLSPERDWQGQHFVHNRTEAAAWPPFRLTGDFSTELEVA